MNLADEVIAIKTEAVPEKSVFDLSQKEIKEIADKTPGNKEKVEDLVKEGCTFVNMPIFQLDEYGRVARLYNPKTKKSMARLLIKPYERVVVIKHVKDKVVIAIGPKRAYMTLPAYAVTVPDEREVIPVGEFKLENIVAEGGIIESKTPAMLGCYNKDNDKEFVIPINNLKVSDINKEEVENAK